MEWFTVRNPSRRSSVRRTSMGWTQDLFDCVNSLLSAMGEMKKLEGGGDNDPFPLSEIERMCKVVRR